MKQPARPEAVPRPASLARFASLISSITAQVSNRLSDAGVALAGSCTAGSSVERDGDDQRARLVDSESIDGASLNHGTPKRT